MQGSTTLVDGQLRQARETEIAELRADMAASSSAEHPVAWLMRPAILRRVAALVAEGVPAEADRIVATGSYGEVIGTAVSLATGLPFSACSEGLDSIRAGERVVVMQLEYSARSVMEISERATVIDHLVITGQVQGSARGLFDGSKPQQTHRRDEEQ